MLQKLFSWLVVASMLIVPAALANPLTTGGTEKAPKPIGAMVSKEVHLVPPREDKVLLDLKSSGVIPLNADKTAVQSAVEDYYKQFSKKSGDWVDPVLEQKALEHEAVLASPQYAAQSVNPVSVQIFALAVDFAGTDTVTYSKQTGTDKNGNPTCGTVTEDFTGPVKGAIPPPGARDNNTVWYTADQTKDASFYKKLIFGHEGAGIVRTDLNKGAGVDLTGYTVQDYYDHVAGGAGNVVLGGDVFGWVSVNHSEGFYGTPDCANGVDDGGATVGVGQLVVDAVNEFNTAHPGYFTDTSATAFWKQYDANQDGYLDTFWLIHAGMGEEAGGGSQGASAIWSHSWALSATIGHPYKVYEGDASTTADDIYIDAYTMQPENADMGVFAEEFGHNVFGLPDLYTYNPSNSIGFWSIMSAGAWGGPLGGAAPVGMPLWFRMIAWCGTDYCNWQNPMDVRAFDDPSAELTIGQLENTPEGASKGVRINLPKVVEDVPNVLDSGKAAFSGLGDGLDETLDRKLTLPATSSVSLSVLTNWSLEKGYDYGYVLLKDANQKWHALADQEGKMVEDPDGTPALNAEGEGALTFDLSAYKGQAVTLRFEYVTDGGVNWKGWTFDHVAINGKVVEDFETAAETFPAGWTNSAPGWQVVPTTRSFTNYYLVEWRNATKYDQMVKTAYVTNYSDDDEWQVERVPYNIPGALVYYRNTKYSNGYDMYPNFPADPSYGPKNSLLVVDMHPEPLRFNVPGRSYPATLGSTADAYDAALTLNGSQAFTLNSISTSAGEITGPFNFSAKMNVRNFNDFQGNYPGFYAGDPCPSGSVCFTNFGGGAVLPARGPYSTRITDFNGVALPDWYGIPMSAIDGGNSITGSGNPGDDNVHYGVNIDLLTQAGDGSTGTLRFWNYSVDMHTSVSSEIVGRNSFDVHYTTVVENNNPSETSGVLALMYQLDPKLKFTSFTAVNGTVDVQAVPKIGPILEFILLGTEPGQKITATLNAHYEGDAVTLETLMAATDGQNSRGPYFLQQDVQEFVTFMPMVSH